jgi:hypothetical protein
VVTLRQMESSRWLVVGADAIALGAFAVAGVVTARDGVDSGALIIGIPPLAVAVLSSVALSAASRWRLRWPLVFAITISGVAMLGAMASFITPLLAVTVPVCGLLIAACAIRLGSPAPTRTAI